MANEGGENFKPTTEERKKAYISSLEQFRKEARNRLPKKPQEKEQQTKENNVVPLTQDINNETIKDVRKTLKENIKRDLVENPTEDKQEDLLQLPPKDNGSKKLSPEERSKIFTTFHEARDKFKDSPRAPESELKYWQARWKAYGALAGLEIDVPACDRTQEEINELTERNRKLIYVPPQLSTPESLTLLGKMHSKLGLYTLKGKNIVNESDVSGWIDVEASPDIPNKGTTEPELRKKIEEYGLIGMNLPVYIIASEDSKDITGQRFDSKITTWVRLPGSSVVNDRTVRTMDACFNSEGFLIVQTISPEISNPLLGGRSMGIKK
ncbi:hypothetical protein KJ980_07965 [Patescibacteria group bacterium]|nr:hypothetical protein [Patescibacteria group bacterium]